MRACVRACVRTYCVGVRVVEDETKFILLFGLLLLVGPSFFSSLLFSSLLSFFSCSITESWCAMFTCHPWEEGWEHKGWPYPSNPSHVQTMSSSKSLISFLYSSSPPSLSPLPDSTPPLLPSSPPLSSSPLIVMDIFFA